jgi:hypothetical protein
LLTFVVIAATYLFFVYESPVTVIHEQSYEVERSPRFNELLNKESLSMEEFKELQKESYEHWKKLSTQNTMSFEEWKKRSRKARKL